ncbi:hypothetical protein [Pseudoflavonifractor sp. An85]|uniref:hypothetical protein n=1 Tax=Pseudoflavonifractor sp. An85 TaxID=1965661 RepID=UPI000B388AD0|nr:hypothetical protein [Pseudoflavonifractor sp. An85]OUN25172.1 hypothetical protein B5G37_04440 [Pseudoflavonifractor sp. An85]
MVWLVLSLLVTGYGVWYAINPVPYLQKRMNRKDVPEKSVRTARIVGIALAAMGVISAICQVVGMTIAG